VRSTTGVEPRYGPPSDLSSSSRRAGCANIQGFIISNFYLSLLRASYGLGRPLAGSDAAALHFAPCVRRQAHKARHV